MRTVLVGSGRGVRRGPVPDLPEVVVGRALTRSGAARAGGRHPTRRPGAAGAAVVAGWPLPWLVGCSGFAGSLVRGDRVGHALVVLVAVSVLLLSPVQVGAAPFFRLSRGVGERLARR